jgi:hypothetical protein
MPNVRGRHQCVEQAHQILYLRHVGQLIFFGLLGGDVQCSQLGLHQAQSFALAGQHHDIAGLEDAGLQLLRNPARSLAALHDFAGFFGDQPRGSERVAPATLVRRCGMSGRG